MQCLIAKEPIRNRRRLALIDAPAIHLSEIDICVQLFAMLFQPTVIHLIDESRIYFSPMHLLDLSNSTAPIESIVSLLAS